MDSVTQNNIKSNLMETNLRVCLWNCRSANHKKEQISVMLKSIDILVVIETWLDQSTTHLNLSYPGFNVLRQDRSNKQGGGIAFIIRKNIAYYTLKNFISPHSEFEILGIKITNFKKPLHIISVYKPPDLNLKQEEWDTLFQQCESLKNTLLIGDFNSHNTSWNCEHNDISGTKLMNS